MVLSVNSKEAYGNGLRQTRSEIHRAEQNPPAYFFVYACTMISNRFVGLDYNLQNRSYQTTDYKMGLWQNWGQAIKKSKWLC